MKNVQDENSPYQLLVEGPDDKHSVIQFMKQRGYDWDDVNVVRPFIRDCGGVEKLLKRMNVILKNNVYTRVGFVLDADTDLASTWHSVRDRLAKIPNATLSSPLEFPAEGYWGSTDDENTVRHVGVWIMPDNQRVGTLEDFLADMIPSEDLCWPYCDEVLQEARNRGAPFKDKDRSKARMHTWLAWRAEPGNPFGQAFMANDLNTDGELAERFYQWFTNLFGITVAP